ncbi:hypothetical protein HFO48_34635 [Rhizobium leguminosarum]|nr:hypothetical protein [Rhizobium leguminosarum]
MRRPAARRPGLRRPVKTAHAVIQTGEPRLYANVILRKGVIYPKEADAHAEVDPFVY